MSAKRNRARMLAALGAPGLIILALAASAAGAGPLTPPAHRVFFGISDTGNSANFGEFSTAASKHPAVIESFRAWGSDFPRSIRRWQTARARPMLHITTADPRTGAEIITPRQIAEGQGDGYLVRLNKLFWAKRMPAYVRPLGEPNRCLNVYASYDCAGRPRGGDHTPRWYKLAFRRIYILLHGGGKRSTINARLAEAGLPPLQVNVGGLPAAPIAVIWSPLPAGSPTTPQNRPRHFYPGARYTDWAGTDFYSGYADWKSLTGLYRRFGGKPFVLTEWAVASRRRTRFRAPPLHLGRAPPALSDADLLPGLRLLEHLPDRELPGEPRCLAPAPSLPHLPRLRARPTASATTAPRWRRPRPAPLGAAPELGGRTPWPPSFGAARLPPSLRPQPASAARRSASVATPSSSCLTPSFSAAITRAPPSGTVGIRRTA